jgi:hypothetical protein
LIEKYGLSENLRTLDSMQMAVIEKLGSDPGLPKLLSEGGTSNAKH